MGVISILIGILTFLGMTGGGAILANALVASKDRYAQYFTALSNISNTTLLVVTICVCGVIGLLICLNLVMHGLTYMKVSKIYKHYKRHH